jgi:hypothetical protein
VRAGCFAKASDDFYMKYLKTVKATFWPEKQSFSSSIVDKWLTKIFPSPNKENEAKFYLVKEWYIEFDDAGYPIREIGLDQAGMPVVASDIEDGTYGYWLDTNMLYVDFLGSDSAEIQATEFQAMWSKYKSLD